MDIKSFYFVLSCVCCTPEYCVIAMRRMKYIPFCLIQPVHFVMNAYMFLCVCKFSFGENNSLTNYI
jgi:hypothetical protein